MISNKFRACRIPDGLNIRISTFGERPRSAPSLMNPNVPLMYCRNIGPIFPSPDRPDHAVDGLAQKSLAKA